MIYIVVGETGTGNERQTWNVAAWRHEISADTHAELATRWLQERNMHCPWTTSTGKVPPVPPWANPYDEYMGYDFLSGTSYHVDAVEILEAASLLGQEERPA